MLAKAACQTARYPTDERTQQTGRPVGRLGRCCGVRPIVRPSGGSAQWATRHGCRVSRPRPWMADGDGPTEQDRSEGMPSHSEAPNVRGRALWLLSRSSKVTRRKGGTNRGRYRSNGYVHPQKSISPAKQPSRASSLPQGSLASTTMAITATKCANLQLNLSQKLHQMVHPATCASHRADMPHA